MEQANVINVPCPLAPGEAALLAQAAAAAGTTVPAMLAAWLAAAVADNMPDALRRSDGE